MQQPQEVAAVRRAVRFIRSNTMFNCRKHLEVDDVCSASFVFFCNKKRYDTHLSCLAIIRVLFTRVIHTVFLVARMALQSHES